MDQEGSSKLKSQPSVDGDLVDRFKTICQERGSAPAIITGDVEVTFSALNMLVDQIVQRFEELEVEPGSVVGMVIDNRPVLIAALLATLQAGCTFVAFDPNEEDANLLPEVDGVSPTVLLVESGYIDRVRHLTNAKKLTGEYSRQCANKASTIISTSSVLSRLSALPRPSRHDPDSLSYITYTSGSTGGLKPVAGSARNLLRFIQWEIQRLGLSPELRSTQFLPPIVDAFFRDTLTPLLAGGTLFVPPRDPMTMGRHALVNWLRERRITLMHCTPALLGRILTAIQKDGALPTLRYVLVAGEILPLGYARKWLSTFAPDQFLINLYGSTETTMVAFSHVVSNSDLAIGYIPVGKPIDGIEAFILDSDERPCEVGVRGEIYIEGPSLSRGYYGRPAATAQAFVCDPRDGLSEEIVYRTGDIGFIDASGILHYLGRKELPTIINDNAVDLYQIQRLLCQSVNVLNAVVLPAGKHSPNESLVAFVLPASDPPPTPQELRQHLHQYIPECTAGFRFIVMRTLPITSRGKIDRRALSELTRVCYSEVYY